MLTSVQLAAGVAGIATLMTVVVVAAAGGDSSGSSDAPPALSPDRLSELALDAAGADPADQPESLGVPASECPVASAALAAAGSPPSKDDHFYPDCAAGLAIAELMNGKR